MRPEIERSIGLVDVALLHTFRELVTGNARWPLLLWGPTGTGKTYAALCLTDFCPDVVLVEADRLTKIGWDPDDFVWQRVRDCELLVVDEVGARTGSANYTAPTDAMERCADLRERHAGRVAVYITNQRPEDLAALYGDRTASRMLCGTVFQLGGDDRRLLR
jgi:DNA replication protein DnaC